MPVASDRVLQNYPRPDHWSASLTHFIVRMSQLGNRRFGVGRECLQRLDHVSDYAGYERMPAASGHCPLAVL